MSPLAAPLGALDGSGAATVTFTLPPGLDPSLAGFELHHASVVLDLAAALAFVSNAQGVMLAPQPGYLVQTPRQAHLTLAVAQTLGLSLRTLELERDTVVVRPRRVHWSCLSTIAGCRRHPRRSMP
jgi:hypothetical protein